VSAGEIALHGESITGRKPHEINRRGLSRSFQVTNLFHRLTVFENVRCACCGARLQVFVLAQCRPPRRRQRAGAEIVERSGSPRAPR